MSSPPLHTDGSLSLAGLGPGIKAVIDGVDDQTPQGRRLMDLGFLPRTAVTMVRRAPLGDPVVYELRGCRICLRRSDAERIRVRTL